MTAATHTAIRQSLLERIQSGEWPLGTLIPNEAELAVEYGCARTTVNRALQSLAEDGLVERKRKRGTRVKHMPVRQATFDIPVIRDQIESAGGAYRHEVIKKVHKTPPASIRARLNIPTGEKALYLETIHYADDQPFAYEVRWVNTGAVPEILSAPLATISANEWLVKTVPFSSGDVVFSAVSADGKIANALKASEGAAIFLIDRTTWLDDEFITTMKLYFMEGYQMHSRL